MGRLEKSNSFVLISCLFLLLGCASKQGGASLEKESIRVASVQYPIEGSHSSLSFLAKLEGFVLAAHEKGADILLFPEWTSLDTWPLGSGLAEREVIESVADNVSAALLEQQKEWSKKYKLLIVTSSVRRKAQDLYLSAFVTLPSGEVFIQDKIYLTKWERDNALSKGEKLLRIPFQGKKLVVVICYDIEFPDLSIQLMRDRPEILLVPSMTESIAGYERVSRSARARAIEQTAYVVTSHTVGKTSKSWQHFGRSELMAPQIAEFPVEEVQGPWSQSHILWIDLDMAALQKMRDESSWQPALSVGQSN